MSEDMSTYSIVWIDKSVGFVALSSPLTGNEVKIAKQWAEKLYPSLDVILLPEGREVKRYFNVEAAQTLYLAKLARKEQADRKFAQRCAGALGRAPWM